MVIKVSVDVLKLEMSMPNAHFRIIHSSEPQKTYPVPPYSTIVGFLANILGDKEQIEIMLEGDLVLGALSRYDYITREYTWLRNLLPSAHTSRFGSSNNRAWQEVSEHMGGQSPVSIEVLNDVHLVLYIYHSDYALLETLQQNVTAPEKWYSHLHLGRAEDWVMVNSAAMISLIVSNNPADLRNSNRYFQWMPEPASAFGIGSYVDEKHYRELYQKIQGPAMLVTSIYRLVKVPYQEKKGKKIKTKSETIRNFEHVPTRLFCSSLPFLSDFTLPAVFVDPELNVPIYMADIVGNNSPGRGG
ncbi:MAG: CRISPR-associated protein Cas5 [Bacteroidales bacterium]